MTPEVSELLERSSAEAIRAIQATDPAAAAAHDERCLVLAGRAMAALIERRVAFPFERAAAGAVSAGVGSPSPFRASGAPSLSRREREGARPA